MNKPLSSELAIDLLKTLGNKTLNDQVALFSQYMNILSICNSLYIKIEAERSLYINKIDTLQKQLDATQELCSHPVIYYNTGQETCSICGKNLMEEDNHPGLRRTEGKRFRDKNLMEEDNHPGEYDG